MLWLWLLLLLLWLLLPLLKRLASQGVAERRGRLAQAPPLAGRFWLHLWQWRAPPGAPPLLLLLLLLLLSLRRDQ